jgi:HK97 gp10 family phage protein
VPNLGKGDCLKVSIKGSKEIIKKLDSLEKKIATKIVRTAIREAAKPILKEAKANIPSDSGNLKKNTKIRTMKRKKGRIGLIVQSSSTDPQGYYGSFVEYGTKYQKAQDNIKKAYDKLKDKTAKQLEEAILKGIEKNAK